MLLKSLPVSLMLTGRRRRRSLGGSKRSRPKYPSRSLAAETCCLSLFSEWTLTLMTSHKKKEEPMRTFNWFTEKAGRRTWSRSVGLIGIRTRNLMSLWRGLMSLCMVWLNCLFAILFVCRFGCFYWGARVSQNVCRCVCFYFWGLCSPRVSLSSYSTCKDAFFKNSPSLF